jgi:cell fate regulator YaaT (PSP1 superfamily)
MSKSDKLVEVNFKGERRTIYRNRNDIEISKGDLVVVEAERGYDIGTVSLMGELVKLKRGKGETHSIIRRAEPKDLEMIQKNKVKEAESFAVCKERIERYKLDMKLIAVEMQHDGSKITFYFTASQRIDFRELVKELAAMYRTRIELRQIGARDEAKRISGMGICGQSQCCTAFLSEFEQITIQMAKDQQLSLNPAKISGNCGRLLCCLRYEESLYHNVFQQFPPQGAEVKINDRKGTITYINVFEEKAMVRFTGAPEEWFTAAEIKEGKKIENVTTAPEK